MLGRDSVQKQDIFIGGLESYLKLETKRKNISENTSERFLIYCNNGKSFEEEMRAFRSNRINKMYNEINTIINRDEYFDGEISQSEIFMKKACEQGQIDYIMEALMQIYLKNLQNVHVLEGILVMISSVPYEVVEPKGQTMAMGLLTNKELLVRDRAIQCFEQWNSKKGLGILKSLDCQPKLLQRYVDKVIMYIERDGTE